ncbi:hypothetical protein ACTXT7_017106, partial [Hymenolepis weldensis]
IEHLRLKKISHRLDNLQKLIQHLEGSSSKKPWFDLSTEGSDIVYSTKSKSLDLANRVYEVWLRQLELREMLKMTSSGVGPNQLPPLLELNSTKLRSGSLLQPTWSNPNQRRQCLCFQHPLSFKSEPCFTCLMYLRGCIDAEDTNHLVPQIHFKASGESGFVSDSDNALRHRCRHRRDYCKLATPPKINRRWSFTLPSDVLVSHCQSPKVSTSVLGDFYATGTRKNMYNLLCARVVVVSVDFWSHEINAHQCAFSDGNGQQEELYSSKGVLFSAHLLTLVTLNETQMVEIVLINRGGGIDESDTSCDQVRVRPDVYACSEFRDIIVSSCIDPFPVFQLINILCAKFPRSLRINQLASVKKPHVGLLVSTF